MTIPVQQQANHTGTALTRTDVVRLLQDVGSPEQLDIRGQKVTDRSSDKTSTFALGFSLGFLFISVVGFLGMVGMRVMLHVPRLKKLLVR